MPIGLSAFQVRASRIGSVLVSTTTLIVPFFLKSLKTKCFLKYEGDDDESLTDISHPKGINSMKGLVIISMIILGSFFIALGSVDPNREATYARLEEEAHYNKTKVHLNAVSSSRRSANHDINDVLDKNLSHADFNMRANVSQGDKQSVGDVVEALEEFTKNELKEKSQVAMI